MTLGGLGGASPWIIVNQAMRATSQNGDVNKERNALLMEINGMTLVCTGLGM